MSHIIPHLPHSILLQRESSRERVITLLDNLLNWTIAINSRSREDKRQHHVIADNDPHKWNDAFFNWTAI